MHIIFQCPLCDKRNLVTPESPAAAIRCDCGWQRESDPSDVTSTDGLTDIIQRCRVCGCDDLWRQKDFPPALGLLFVSMGIIFSSIAWFQHLPVVALGILMGFALIDLVLYTFMGDMLVCYRCRARHRKTTMNEDHPGFNLEVAERYRQLQLKQTKQTS